jgi:hypothetical protein
MSNRLDQEREKRLEPKRIQFAVDSLKELGYEPVVIGKRVEFEHNGNKILLYPYSGWHTGKGITDGRGVQKLLKQLNSKRG